MMNGYSLAKVQLIINNLIKYNLVLTGFLRHNQIKSIKSLVKGY